MSVSSTTITANEASSSSDGEDLLVRKDIFVRASRERAFEVFTKRMKEWWPVESHHVGKSPVKELVIDPFVGGRLAEIGIDGSECVWGHVLAFDPPGYFAFRWELSATFQVDPAIDTQVQVTFTEVTGGTHVDLVHRGLRAYGEKAEEMRKIFGSEGGWTSLLEAFAKKANEAI